MRAAWMTAAFAVVLGGCVGPRGRGLGSVSEADTTRAEWGDEHPGLIDDDAEADTDDVTRPSAVFLDGVLGERRTVSARASLDALAARVRAVDENASGAVEWNGRGTLRHVVAGVVRPTVGEGALLADRRDDAQLRARPSATVGGLRLAPSTLVWGTAIGGGVSMAVLPILVSVGGWRLREDPSARAAWGSVEWSGRDATVGASAGASRTRIAGGDEFAASVFAGRRVDAGWVSAEAGSARGNVRALARAVLGDRHQWRAVVAAGQTPRESILTPTSRWGAAIERHDAWPVVASRTTLLTSARRLAGSDERRRRVEWIGSWRVDARVTVELAGRFTRDEESAARPSPFVVPVSLAHDDDLRARLSLRTRDVLSPSLVVENQYRVEMIEDHRDGVGLVAVWAGRVRWGHLDARLRASAQALRSGQVAYVSNAGLAGTGAFTAASTSGAGLVASLRVVLGPHANLGVQASHSATAATDVRLFAATAW